MSECREFQLIPLDSGRSYWSAKRLKTNYTVFNEIMSNDLALQADELRHKVSLQRLSENPFLSGAQSQFPSLPLAFPQPSEESKVEGAVGYRHHLNPVAMPGSSSSSRLSQAIASPTLASPTMPTSPQQAPQVPVRSPHKSSLLQSNTPAIPSRQPRPMSDLSMISSTFTECETASIVTRQSVNEILSMADMSMYSGDDINIENINFDSYLQDVMQSNPPAMTKPSPIRKPSVDYMGSMSSVATVRENKVSLMVEEKPVCNNFDLDLDQICDDAMECVYDDVDVKYDDVDFKDVNDPPVPPVRKRGLSVDRTAEGLDKPLPTAPKNPSIITKISGISNKCLKEIEKEMEKKKQIEEQKQKEKELLEEQKRKEKEEKEKKKLEEKEKKRQEEEERKQKKKREEEEKKKKAEIESEKVNQSLFQRIFQRNQSKLDEEENKDCLDPPPPVPAHASSLTLAENSFNSPQENGVPSPLNFDEDMSDIDHLLSQVVS